MTKAEQRLADEQAETSKQLAELKRRQKDLVARKAKLAQQQLQARYLVVGKLVERVGMLWAEDADIVQALQEGQNSGRTLPPTAPR